MAGLVPVPSIVTKENVTGLSTVTPAGSDSSTHTSNMSTSSGTVKSGTLEPVGGTILTMTTRGRNVNCTEVSLFQGVGIEEFHCIQTRCPHFRMLNRGVPLYTEVSSFQGVGIEEYVPLYTEVSSFQGVGIEEFQCIQRCPHFRVLE